MVRVEEAVEDGAAADGVRELKGRGTAGPVRGQRLPGARSVLPPTTRVSGDRQGIWAHLDGELLAGGPPLPSKLARPGPVRAPSPPGRGGSQGWPSASLLHTQTHTHTLHHPHSQAPQASSPSPPRPAGPMSCISWLWLMLPSRLCRPPSPATQRLRPGPGLLSGPHTLAEPGRTDDYRPELSAHGLHSHWSPRRQASVGCSNTR